MTAFPASLQTRWRSAPASSGPALSVHPFRLFITGHVERTLRLSPDEIREGFWMEERREILAPPEGLPRCSQGRGFTRCWAGIPLSVLLRAAGLRPKARRLHLFAEGAHKGRLSLPLSATKHDGASGAHAPLMLCYAANDAPAQREQGGPLRLVSSCGSCDVSSLHAIVVTA